MVRRILLCILAFGYACGADSAGFEKSIPWSGRYAGSANAAVSEVDGSQALYFNPASLAATGHGDLSINLSGIYSQFSAPIAASSTVFTSPRVLSAGFGIFARMNPNAHFGLGVGAFSLGGEKSSFENLDLSASSMPGFRTTLKSDLNLNEYSLGAAYEILDGLKVGVAWRIVAITGNLGFLNLGSTSTNVILSGLQDTEFDGYRIGIHYTPGGAVWGVGASFRSAIRFNTTPTASGSAFTPPATISPITPVPAPITPILPEQFSIGFHYAFVPNVFRGMLQYEFTEYQLNHSIPVPGLPALQLNWNNLNRIRAGMEFKANDRYTLRAGYSLASQLTPSDSANPIFSPPGLEHSLTVGMSDLLSQFFEFALTGEYSFADANSSTAAPVGIYSANSISAHAGVSVFF